MENPQSAIRNPQSTIIGLFGGSFNPPHMAHVMVAAWALAGGEVDEVWVIPSGGHPFGKELAPFEDRMEMCRRAFACFGERVRLLDVERAAGVHYSIDTLRALKELYPAHGWRWIMGSDTLEDAGHWKEWEELMRAAPALIVPRREHMPAELKGASDFALPDISSTLVRGLLAERRIENLEKLIPRPVLEWILERGLYNKK